LKNRNAIQIRAMVRGTPSPTATPMAALVPVPSPEEAAAVVDKAVGDVSDEVIEDEVVEVVAVVVDMAAVDDVDPTYVTVGTLSGG